MLESLLVYVRSWFKSTWKNMRAWLPQGLRYQQLFPIAFITGVVLAVLYYTFISGPRDLQVPAIIKIKDGETLQAISLQLQQEHVIRNAALFELIVRLLGGNEHVQAGSYFFASSENVIVVALRFNTGDFELNPVRIYIPEGSTAAEIAATLSNNILLFDKQGFLQAAAGREGHLYPDTYFFYPGEDPVEVEHAMEANLDDHLVSIKPAIVKSGKTLQQLLTMASILVGEARTDTDRKIVSGILWKRIGLGIPLQVDAPFGYVINKPLTHLTLADLQIDSPYNTYLNKGLPPTSINNPALEAIVAAAAPTKTPYLYYISDNSGTMHFSATFAQHQQQILEYLK